MWYLKELVLAELVGTYSPVLPVEQTRPQCSYISTPLTPREVVAALTVLNVGEEKLLEVMNYAWQMRRSRHIYTPLVTGYTPSVGCIVRYRSRVLNRVRWGVVEGATDGNGLEDCMVRNIKVEDATRTVLRRTETSTVEHTWKVGQWGRKRRKSWWHGRHWCTMEDAQYVVGRGTGAN